MRPAATNRRRARDSARAGALVVLREHGPVSRTELAGRLDLPKSTVAAVVDELLADGSIVETPACPGGSGSGSGRPARSLRLAGIDGVVLGIDFGHRHVRVALADGDCRILGEDAAEMDVDRRATEALDAAGDLLAGVLDQVGVTRSDVRAAAAGIPGPVNPVTGTMQSPTILADWVDLDLRSALRARTGLNVSVDNDANLGAIGEQARGSGHGYRDFIYVKASNGIGACLVLGGAVYRGSGGMAGEIGHTQLDPEGLWCRCGNRGCLEALVSVDVVRRQLEPLGIDPLDADDVTHPVARKVLAESGRTVGRVLANLCNALDPEAVVLGGDLSLTGTAFVDGVRDSIERLAQPGASAVATVPARLGRRAELIGTLTAAVTEARSA